jgi:hypothetical protein
VGEDCNAAVVGATGGQHECSYGGSRALHTLKGSALGLLELLRLGRWLTGLSLTLNTWGCSVTNARESWILLVGFDAVRRRLSLRHPMDWRLGFLWRAATNRNIGFPSSLQASTEPLATDFNITPTESP